jgi:hypothetical protein
MDRPPASPESSTLGQLRFVYGELLRIEAHWTGQVQNQQARIGSILAVNGFLLGLFGGLGFLSDSFPGDSWPAHPFFGSISALCVALVCGTMALLPRPCSM